MTYHKVDREASTKWWVDADSFYRQMLELADKEVVFLDDYNPDNKDQAVIAFDGVYENVYQYAFPILQKFNYPFELFVTGDCVGQLNDFDEGEPETKFAGREQLMKMVGDGGRLQWHTRSHACLSDLEKEQIKNELEVPSGLKELDTNGFKWIAYPHSDFDQDVIQAAKEKFNGAVAGENGNDKIYSLKRKTVLNNTKLTKKTIGVVIASYNYGHFLIEAVESVLRQTRMPDLILISDDCSTDNTGEIAAYYQKKYPDLVLFNSNQENLGIVKHFNIAVNLSDTDYVSILGADNRMRSDYIEKTANVLDTSANTAIAYTDFSLFGPRARLIYEKFDKNYQGKILDKYFYVINFPDFDDTTKKHLNTNNFIHGTSLFRKNIFTQVGGYKMDTGKPEDHDLFVRMTKKYEAKRVAEPLLEYRQHTKEQLNERLASYLELKFYKNEYKKTVELEKKLGKQKEEIADLNAKIDILEGNLRSLQNSTSWKITQPLRTMSDRAKGLKRRLKRSGEILNQEGGGKLVEKIWQNTFSWPEPYNKYDWYQNDFMLVNVEEDIKNHILDFDEKRPVITCLVPFNFLYDNFGGSKRVLSIYQGLADMFNVNLIGITGLTDKIVIGRMSENINVYILPHSQDFHDQLIREEQKAGGPLHDVLLINGYTQIPWLMSLVEGLDSQTDIMVSSHPYFWRLVGSFEDKTRIYDAHNVDSILKETYFPQNEFARQYLNQIKLVEEDACQNADYVMAVSQFDKEQFVKLYNVDQNKIVIVPNGIDLDSYQFLYNDNKSNDIVFIGTAHHPNIEAVEFIMDKLAALNPAFNFIIIGN
ncbi:glycosyltransferase, partial [Patescibacteria group bacterium]|nr:glycosyltransferase [Patescibacteria group bacterium]